MSALKPGDMCGGHRIVRVLGQGGQACVYEAVAPDGEPCALKVLATASGFARRDAARLAQEAAILAEIIHPNVLRFYDGGVDGERVWLRVALVRGESLREKTKRRGEPPALVELLRWVAQAADGVAAAHDLGIVHRDVKPENLLVRPDDVVVVIDFGFAKFDQLGIKTTTGALVGTALYAPPEQLRGGPAHPSWDVYALGVVLHEALVGAHPIGAPSPNPVDVWTRHVSLRPSPLALVAPHLPGDLTYLVDLALHPDPAERPTMHAFAEGLRTVIFRLNAPLRAWVRNLPIGKRTDATAPTEPMPAYAPAPPRAAPTPIPAWRADPAPGDRAALPPPPARAAVAPSRAPVLAATLVDATMGETPIPPPRASAAGGHDVSAAPVEAAARAPAGRRGRAAFAVVAVLLAASAGGWAWYVRAPGGAERAPAAAGSGPVTGVEVTAGRAAPPVTAGPAVSASSTAPRAPRPGAPAERRGKRRGFEPLP